MVCAALERPLPGEEPRVHDRVHGGVFERAVHVTVLPAAADQAAAATAAVPRQAGAWGPGEVGEKGWGTRARGRGTTRSRWGLGATASPVDMRRSWGKGRGRQGVGRGTGRGLGGASERLWGPDFSLASVAMSLHLLIRRHCIFAPRNSRTPSASSAARRPCRSRTTRRCPSPRRSRRVSRRSWSLGKSTPTAARSTSSPGTPSPSSSSPRACSSRPKGD